MDANLTEHQQVEELKKLWKENRWPIIIGVAIALIVTFGWHHYRSYTLKKTNEASILFQRMIIHNMNDDLTDSKQFAKLLLKNYPRTVYSSSAGLLLAKQYVDQQEWDRADHYLQWVIRHSRVKAYRQVARIRSARIYIEQKKFDKALGSLSKVDDESFDSEVNEVRGDAYVKKGALSKARQAYQTALKQLPKRVLGSKSLLQMKLDDLPAESKVE